jgi:hypothetical protein
MISNSAEDDNGRNTRSVRKILVGNVVTIRRVTHSQCTMVCFYQMYPFQVASIRGDTILDSTCRAFKLLGNAFLRRVENTSRSLNGHRYAMGSGVYLPVSFG